MLELSHASGGIKLKLSLRFIGARLSQRNLEKSGRVDCIAQVDSSVLILSRAVLLLWLCLVYTMLRWLLQCLFALRRGRPASSCSVRIRFS